MRRQVRLGWDIGRQRVTRIVRFAQDNFKYTPLGQAEAAELELSGWGALYEPRIPN
jgi:hypothetical protein